MAKSSPVPLPAPVTNTDPFIAVGGALTVWYGLASRIAHSFRPLLASQALSQPTEFTENSRPESYASAAQ